MIRYCFDKLGPSSIRKGQCSPNLLESKHEFISNLVSSEGQSLLLEKQT